MAELQQAAQQDLERIRDTLEDITGLRSRWSSVVTVDPLSVSYLGVKRWACDIGIREDVLQHLEQRWTTMIHESLHAVSVGLTPDALAANRGWEEGVIEQVQRVIRSDVLARLSIALDNRSLQDIDRVHPYNYYIGALERLRRRLDIDANSFYLDLLTMPLSDRPEHVRLLGESHFTGDARRLWSRSFENAHRALKEPM